MYIHIYIYIYLHIYAHGTYRKTIIVKPGRKSSIMKIHIYYADNVRN